MAKKSNIRKNWPKYLLQWGTLAAVAAFISGMFPCISTPDLDKFILTDDYRQVLRGIILLAAIVFFGKLFCGFICPLSTIQELLTKLRSLLNIKSIKIRNGSIADKVLRIFKYALLFFIVFLAAEARDMDKDLVLWLSVTSSGLIVLGCFVTDLFWCRFLCPLGAILNSIRFWTWIVIVTASWVIANEFGVTVPWIYLLGTVCSVGYLVEILHGKPSMQILHVTKDEVPCNNCGECVKACPYHIDLRTFHNGKVNHIDCTLCGECIASCHTSALNIGVSKPNKKRIWNLLPPVLAIVLVAFAVRLLLL